MAEKRHIVHLNMYKQQLLNAALQVLAVPPSDPAIGQVYWNTADTTAYAWTGSSWLNLGQVYTHPTYPGVGQPTNALTGASVISRITLENGHVTGVTVRNLTAADIGASSSLHTHNFGEIVGLPTQTILGNNTGSTGPAQALTVADLMIMMSIAYGNLSLLTTGTNITQRTWTAKDLSDYVTSRLGSYVTVVDLALGTRTSTTMPITNSAGTGVTLLEATTSLAGLLTAADKAKLDGIASNANNYIHPTDNPGIHPFASEITSGLLVLSQLVVNNQGHTVGVKGRNLTAADIATVMINNLSNIATDQTWSASKIYQEIQNAINQASTGALQYKGEYNPITNTPNITVTTPAGTIKAGYTYVVSVAGTFAGQDVEAGDMIIAKTDDPGNVAANWQIVNKNIPAIVSASTVVEGIIYIATLAEALAGTNNTKAITPATLKSVLDSNFGGYYALFGNGSSTSFTITHGLGTDRIQVQIRVVATKEEVILDWRAASSTTVTLNMNVPPANNEYEIIIDKVKA